MSFSTRVFATEGVVYQTTTDKRGRLGSVAVLPDGRRYVYVEMGGTVAVEGRLFQAPVPSTNFINENPTVAAVLGATTVTMDVAATPTLDQFAEGYLVDETNGHTYSVRGNTAADPTVVTLENPDGLLEDLAVADVVSLFQNPCKDVIIHPSPPTTNLVGVAPSAIAADRFGWLQTWGVTGVLVQGTLVVGDKCIASATVDGAVAPSASDTEITVGQVLEIGADGQVGTIFLTVS